jgi:hypothetical protein
LPVYAPDEEIVVNYFNNPGSTQNWIGIFDAGPGTNPDDHTDYLTFEYLSGANGSVSFSGQSTGDYEARLFFGDLFNLEDRVEFTVAGCNENGICDPGENCHTCTDCDGRTTGKPRRGTQKRPISTRFCCGNGVVEAPETSLICDGSF